VINVGKTTRGRRVIKSATPRQGPVPHVFLVTAKVWCLVLISSMLWLGGLNCLACCVSISSDSCCEPLEDAETIALERMAGQSGECLDEHSCCAAPESETTASIADGSLQSEGMKCCVLRDGASSPAALPHSVSDRGSSPKEGASPVLSNIEITAICSAAPAAPPPRGSETYLRCCVLLI
jgi:hypothetical protein